MPQLLPRVSPEKAPVYNAGKVASRQELRNTFSSDSQQILSTLMTKGSEQQSRGKASPSRIV